MITLSVLNEFSMAFSQRFQREALSTLKVRCPTRLARCSTHSYLLSIFMAPGFTLQSFNIPNVLELLKHRGEGCRFDVCTLDRRIDQEMLDDCFFLSKPTHLLPMAQGDIRALCNPYYYRYCPPFAMPFCHQQPFVCSKQNLTFYCE
jgi:hypothetical protein